MSPVKYYIDEEVCFYEDEFEAQELADEDDAFEGDEDNEEVLWSLLDEMMAEFEVE